MSAVLDLEVHGDPRACRRAATEIGDAATALDDVSGTLSALVSSAGRAWTGAAADAFLANLHDARKDVDGAGDRLASLGRAVDGFAAELEVVLDAMTDVRSSASAAGLSTGPCFVVAPGALAAGASAIAIDDHRRMVHAWDTAVEVAQAARVAETAAHDELGRALRAVLDVTWWHGVLDRLGFVLPGTDDVPAGALWVLDRVGLAFSTSAEWMTRARYGVFQPRVAGQFASPSAFTAWHRGVLSISGSNWHARPYSASARDAWSTAGRWAGRAGAIVSFGTAAWDQWSQDTDDPSLSTGERAGRAAAVGTATAAGAWGGAWVGAQAGGAIGTMICPGLGTVIGGALGGLIGGFAGSELGGLVGDAIKESAGQAVEAVTGFVGEAAGTVGDIVSGLGDTLTFWD